jgi:RecG-like helicase
VVGTHALFQDEVVFRDLGLAVIDERHRFGVYQRLALGKKGEAADILVMTATPIPRTLVLSYFGDMDVSNLREKPLGHQTVETRSLASSMFVRLHHDCLKKRRKRSRWTKSTICRRMSLRLKTLS